LLLALIILVGGLIWLALDRVIESVIEPSLPEGATSPEFRFVKGGGDAGATPPETMVWLTSTALEDCAQVRNRRSREVKRRLEDLLSSASPSRDQGEEDACAPFQLGKVAAGTRVEILGECGEMTRIKISSGRLQGQQGCIENDRLEDRPARSEEPPAAPRS
jgi:hypothetical protein